MSDNATAVPAPNPISDALDDLTAATAIEPDRVMVLSEAEQDTVLGDGDPAVYALLAHRIVYGDSYADAIDELARRTLRKRRLEEEVRRENRAIAAAEEIVVEQMAALGVKRLTHDGTGATLSMTRRVWAKLDVDTGGMDKATADAIRADRKAQVGGALHLVGLGDLVRPDFNLNTLSAVFREQIKAYDEEQCDLPEHERSPRTAQDFLPEPLAGLLRIDDDPHVSVRA